MLQAEMLRKIDEAILALPDQQRLAIVLRRYDEFTYEQIAEDFKNKRAGDKIAAFPGTGNASRGLAGLSRNGGPPRRVLK